LEVEVVGLLWWEEGVMIDSEGRDDDNSNEE
jgi:hypothetical protein